jgi:Tfp pilus assembly protein PilF
MDRRATLEQFVAANPTDSFARYGLAMEYVRAGNAQAALAEFEKILATDPDYTAAYQMAAQTLINLGRNPEARDWLQRGIGSAARTGNARAKNEMQGMLDELN